MKLFSLLLMTAYLLFAPVQAASPLSGASQWADTPSLNQLQSKGLEEYGQKDKNFWEKLRDWDWDFTEVWDALWDTAQYHIQNNGWVGIVAVVVVAMFFFLWFDLTSHAASLTLASGIRSIFTLLTVGTVGVVYKGFILGKDLLVAKSRNTARLVNDVMKKNDR